VGSADPATLAGELAQRRGPLPRSKDLPADAGIYAVWGSPVPGQPPAVDSAAAEILYVGRGDPSLRRRFAEEWRPRTSGRSSPRRTLGALLQSELGLVPVPRQDRDIVRGARYYCFADDGEARLTEWCDQHLEFAAVTCARGEADGLETALIALLMPPLNLTKWQNPDAPRLRALRRRLAQEALRHPLEAGRQPRGGDGR